MNQIAIADYADDDGVVRDRTFEDCEIIGPVALVPAGSANKILDCEFPYTPESLAQIRFGMRSPVVLIGCTLRQCRFALDVDTSALTAN
jgi:hypothetical protein